MKYKVNKGFIVQKLGDKSTIFDGEESALYSFNKTGSVIFDKIKSGWDRGRITEYLVKNYKVNRKLAETDVNDFIKELQRSKIIRKA